MIPLIILGLLKQQPDAYGYELLSLMEKRHYQYIVNFTKGSFYYNLQQLEEKKLIEKVDIVKQAKDREAQHYRITQLGDIEFDKLMYKFGVKSEYINLSFYGTMLFANDYPKDKFQQIIQEQIAECRKKIALLERSIEQDQGLPVHFKRMLENSRAHHQVNLTWFEDLLKE